MAIIIPYADPNAHGSIGGAVSFRRRYGSVVFEKKPYPKQPNSAGQLAQRQAFKDAGEDWYQIDAVSKVYYNQRGNELGMSGRSLYIKAALLGILPSTDVLYLKDIQNAIISYPRGASAENVTFDMQAEGSPNTFGNIKDNNNVWIDGYEHSPGLGLRIRISKYIGDDVTYFFRDSFLIHVLDGADVERDILIRLPGPFTVGTTQTFYAAADGSLYYNTIRTVLAATNNF